MERRRTLLMAALCVALTFATLAGGYLFFFDVERYVERRSTEHFAELISGKAPAASSVDLARFHAGAPPCFSTVMNAPNVTDAERSAAIDELEAAGVLEHAAASGSLLAWWHLKDERARHGPLSEEELIEGWLMFPNLEDRFALLFRRTDLAITLRRRAADIEARTSVPAAQQAGGLREEERAALKAVFDVHRGVFALPALLKTLEAVRPRVTQLRMNRVADSIRAFHAQKKQMPASVTDLRGMVAETDLRDGWDQAWRYSVHGLDATLSSLGADYFEGGTGDEADLSLSVKVGE